MAAKVGETAIEPEKQTMFISHGDCRQDAEYLAGLLREKYHVPKIEINYVGPVIGSHSGPGTPGALFPGHPPLSTARRGCLIKSQPLCKMHSSNSRAVHFAPPAGGLLNAQGAQGRPLHTSPAKFLCIFLSCCYFETTRFILSLYHRPPGNASSVGVDLRSTRAAQAAWEQRRHEGMPPYGCSGSFGCTP